MVEDTDRRQQLTENHEVGRLRVRCVLKVVDYVAQASEQVLVKFHHGQKASTEC